MSAAPVIVRLPDALLALFPGAPGGWKSPRRRLAR